MVEKEEVEGEAGAEEAEEMEEEGGGQCLAGQSTSWQKFRQSDSLHRPRSADDMCSRLHRRLRTDWNLRLWT